MSEIAWKALSSYRSYENVVACGCVEVEGMLGLIFSPFSNLNKLLI